MFPLVGLGRTVKEKLSEYRKVFCREAGFRHIERYINGLLLSENKTLEGIHSRCVFGEGEKVSRRAMHESVFESGWSHGELMKVHRGIVGNKHRGRGREVLSLDWTFGYHPYSHEIYGAKPAYDYVNGRWSCYQTVVTAAIANPHHVDGVAVELQFPNYEKEERAYLEMTAQESYEQMELVHERLSELLHYQKNRLGYRKRTEIAVDIVRQLEEEGEFPKADYAFDQGVLSCPLTEAIEASGKHWVSEIESSRLILWKGDWQRVDGVAVHLRETAAGSFRPKTVRCRNGKTRQIWAFTKVIRLKKYGRKRLVICHETADLSDAPRFLLTDALHWDSARTFSTWTFRWPIETFHEFSKQLVGFESAQLRKEEAVRRHFCLSCVAQSILQHADCPGRKSDSSMGTLENESPIGQRLYSLSRESLVTLLELVQASFSQGKSVPQMLELLMPT